MKKSITLPVGLIGRADDLAHIQSHALRGLCCSLVGVSNLGKSEFARHLSDASETGTFVYIDCNQMPEPTYRAFFMIVWRALANIIETKSPRSQDRARAMMQQLTDTTDTTNFALVFDAGLAFAMDTLAQPLVLCFDDFDEAYHALDAQAFLNLRAFKDRYPDSLVYVTATEREFTRMPWSRERGEFLELIGARVHYLHFWQADDTRRYCEYFAARENVTFSEADLTFIRDHADGHPGIVQALCFALGNVTGAPKRNAQQDRVIHQSVEKKLASDAIVQSECLKIWEDLDPDEHEALMDLARTDETSRAWQSLSAKFIVRENKGEWEFFSRVFGDYVRQQKILTQRDASGVYIDVETERVSVDGKPIEALTDLEYRLLLFLYGRMDRVCDKYAIVQGVWGEEFIDEVDDARIEKLVSRLRQKVEPDPAHPRYLLSLRGRGYKLVR
jgi:DNA-binding winged helix-turn-helix (wHTH) protein